MNPPAVETLFDEFARAYLRGERPDVRAFLERAGTEREALARMLDRFLQAVPAREPSEEEVVLLRARLEAEPPLLVARRRRRLTRAAVVDALVRTLGLDPAKREKVAGYYHALESGLLDPEPVSPRVWETLGELLRANARALAAVRAAPPAAEPAYRRADEDFVLPEPAPGPPPAERDDERDEIDRLFTGTS